SDTPIAEEAVASAEPAVEPVVAPDTDADKGQPSTDGATAEPEAPAVVSEGTSLSKDSEPLAPAEPVVTPMEEAPAAQAEPVSVEAPEAQQAQEPAAAVDPVEPAKPAEVPAAKPAGRT